MFTGFNLIIDNDSFNHYHEYGEELFASQGRIIEGDIRKYVQNDGSLSATEMQSDWFPKIDADIFISHSHKNEKLAKALAGFLQKEFNLSSFIDSCVWGYADNLLREIDNQYSKNPDGNSYSYDKRNITTSHIHMILSVALAKMIDKTECLFFLNTPESIKLKDNIDNEGHTFSPWIYYELSLSKLIMKKRERGITLEKRAMLEQFKVTYDVDFSHLIKMGVRELHLWLEAYKRYRTDALELLYDNINEGKLITF